MDANELAIMKTVPGVSEWISGSVSWSVGQQHIKCHWEKVLKMAKQKSMTCQLQAAFNLDRHRNGIETEKGGEGGRRVLKGWGNYGWLNAKSALDMVGDRYHSVCLRPCSQFSLAVAVAFSVSCRGHKRQQPLTAAVCALKCSLKEAREIC